jgi:hypothetical protein
VPKEQFAEFAADLDRLPPAVAPGDVVAAEKPTFVLVHRRLIDDPRAREMLKNMSDFVHDTFGGKSAPLDLDDLVADPAKRDATFKEIEKLFDDMSAALPLPPEQRDAQWKALGDRVKNAHPLTQRAAQVGVMARHVHEGRQVMRFLLDKAVELLGSAEVEDDAAAARLAAPYSFARRAGGFALTHKPPGAKYPHILTIGPHDPVDWDAIDKKMEEDGPFPADDEELP